MELRGRVALVTGAAHRVGRAIALTLGAQGARLAVHYHGSAAEAEATVDELRAGGTEAHALQADLRRADAPEALVRSVVEAFGALDLLVNSAAVLERTPFGETTPDQWDDMFALNLRAPFLLTQAAAERLTAARGAVVNIADLAAFETWPAYVPHSITKAGIVQLTRSLARVMAPEVRVNAVAPGVVLLPEGCSEAEAERLRATTPLRRIGSAEDVAGAVRYLLESDFVTGEVLIVDGGRHVRT